MRSSPFILLSPLRIAPKAEHPAVLRTKPIPVKSIRRPAGNFLLAANQDSDTIVIFRIDPQSGGLKATGQLVEVPPPVCVKIISMQW